MKKVSLLLVFAVVSIATNTAYAERDWIKKPVTLDICIDVIRNGFVYKNVRVFDDEHLIQSITGNQHCTLVIAPNKNIGVGNTYNCQCNDIIQD